MKEGGGGTNACVCMGTQSFSYRTDWWMLTKLGRDEVIMALHMCLGFSARSAQRWIQVRCYVYCLCITHAIEYGVPRCANLVNNWGLQLQNTCNLLQREINCIDLTWDYTGYIDSGFIHDCWCKNRSMRGLFSKGLLLQIGMQQQQTEGIPVSWTEISRLFAVQTDLINMAVKLSDLLRNLTFNRSSHCTQVSDPFPLGLLFNFLWRFCHWTYSDLFLFY